MTFPWKKQTHRKVRIGRVLKSAPARHSNNENDEVTIGRRYVTIRYNTDDGERIVKLSKNSIIANADKALAEVPVML